MEGPMTFPNVRYGNPRVGPTYCERGILFSVCATETWTLSARSWSWGCDFHRARKNRSHVGQNSQLCILISLIVYNFGRIFTNSLPFTDWVFPDAVVLMRVIGHDWNFFKPRASPGYDTAGLVSSAHASVLLFVCTDVPIVTFFGVPGA